MKCYYTYVVDNSSHVSTQLYSWILNIYHPLLAGGPGRDLPLDVNLVHDGVGQLWVPAYHRIVQNKL